MDLGPRVGVVPQASCHLARAQVIVSRRIRFLVYNSVFCFKQLMPIVNLNLSLYLGNCPA